MEPEIKEETPQETPQEQQQEPESDDDHDQFFHYKEIKCFQNIPPNSIDDNISDTVGREVTGMAFKFSVVLYPSEKRRKRLKSWDLWGPFFMALIFGIFINNATQFLMLFAAIFGGALVVTFNTRTLGGKISFFQSISILGYCVFPLFLVGAIIKLLAAVGFSHMIVKLILMLIGAFWGVISAKAFISNNLSQKKRGVAAFPILLFYLFIGLLILYL